MAREFANMIHELGIPETVRCNKRSDAELYCGTGKTIKPDVDFLGIYDTVASFGLGGNDINYGYDLSIPPNVTQVRHAIAANEHRTFFPLESIRTHMGDPLSPSWIERAFRGAHSDVGGGYKDARLSRAPLVWMWQEMRDSGIEIGPLMGLEREVDPTFPLHDSRWPMDKMHTENCLQFHPRKTFYYLPKQ